jgi:hypothetical protein
MENKVGVKPPWGLFGLNGSWQANPLLKMTADEQYQQNVLNGYIKCPQLTTLPELL